MSQKPRKLQTHAPIAFQFIRILVYLFRWTFFRERMENFSLLEPALLFAGFDRRGSGAVGRWCWHRFKRDFLTVDAGDYCNTLEVDIA